MDHGLSIENRVRADLLKIAKDLKLPLVATNDLHYTHQSDARRARGSPLRADRLDHGRWEPVQVRRRPALPQVAGRDARAVRRAPEACDNTLAIAERCDISFTDGNGTYMPRYPCPEGETEDSWFVHEVEAGLRRRYPGGIPDAVRKQADFETSVIISMGYAGYFLVVADFINWAKGARHPRRARPWLWRRLDRRLRDADHRS